MLLPIKLFKTNQIMFHIQCFCIFATFREWIVNQLNIKWLGFSIAVSYIIICIFRIFHSRHCWCWHFTFFIVIMRSFHFIFTNLHGVKSTLFLRDEISKLNEKIILYSQSYILEYIIFKIRSRYFYFAPHFFGVCCLLYLYCYFDFLGIDVVFAKWK